MSEWSGSFDRTSAELPSCVVCKFVVYSDYTGTDFGRVALAIISKNHFRRRIKLLTQRPSELRWCISIGPCVSRTILEGSSRKRKTSAVTVAALVTSECPFMQQLDGGVVNCSYPSNLCSKNIHLTISLLTPTSTYSPAAAIRCLSLYVPMLL